MIRTVPRGNEHNPCYQSEKVKVSHSVMSNSLQAMDSIAYQVPLSMGFSRQEYFSGLPLASPGDLSDPEMDPGSLALQADSLPSEPPGKPYLFVALQNSL